MQETFVDTDLSNSGFRSEYLLNVAQPSSSGLHRSASNVASSASSKDSSGTSGGGGGKPAPISKPVRRSKSHLNTTRCDILT